MNLSLPYADPRRRTLQSCCSRAAVKCASDTSARRSVSPQSESVESMERIERSTEAYFSRDYARELTPVLRTWPLQQRVFQRPLVCGVLELHLGATDSQAAIIGSGLSSVQLGRLQTANAGVRPPKLGRQMLEQLAPGLAERSGVRRRRHS